MPPAFRALPPLAPRVPLSSKAANGSGTTSTGTRSTSIEDPAPAHLSLPSFDGNDLAEPRDFDNFCEHPKNNQQAQNNQLNLHHQNNNSGAVVVVVDENVRRQKVSSTDVASVGNASDTGIPYSKADNDSVVVFTTGRALHERAKLALNAGNHAEALELFQAILDAQRMRFGTCHTSVAAAMHNVGVCRQRMGHYPVAETLLAEAVSIREKTLGKYNVEVAASLSKLGSVRISLGKFEEAFCDLRKALQIAKTAHAPDQSKTVAQMLCHLACLYFEKGELFAAQATFQDALDIYRKVLSSESLQESKNKNVVMLQLTDTLCNIGSILNRRKCFAQAIGNFQEALDLQRGILEQDHPRIISTLDNLAYSYSKNKEYARAVTCYRAMLRAQVSQSKTFTEECFLTFRKRIIMYEKLKLTAEAILDTKDVLRIQKNYLSKDHAIVLETKALLDELQAKQSR